MAGVGASLLCATALGIAGPPAALADTGDQKRAADQQVAQLQAALEGTSTELANAFLALQITQAKLVTAQATLASARASEQIANRRNDEAAARLAVARANEARAVEAAATNKKKLEETQTTLDNFAADLFQGGGSGSQLSVALGATSADDFATRVVLADTVTSLTNNALQDLQNTRAEGQAQQAYLTAVRAEIAQLKMQAQVALEQAQAARAIAAAAKQNLDALAAQQASYAAQVEARKGAEQAQLAAAEAEQARLQALLVEQARQAAIAEAARAAAARAAKQAYVPVTGGTGFLAYPANGPVTSEFGMRLHPILQVWKLHTGTDFGIPCGTPIFATAPGTIISAGWGGGDGNRIVIDHGMVNGVDLVTTYNHLESFAKTGGPVQRGEVIGYSGSTGYSTGCHFHFETLENGQFVNPRKWI